MSNRASTPTAPTPAAPAATPSSAPPAPYEHKIIMPPRPVAGDDQGQKPNTLAAKSAQVREAARSQLASSDDDDPGDDDEPQTRQASKPTRTTPLGQAAAPAKPDNEAAPEPSAREKNAARIRESLKAQTAAREAEQARRVSQAPAQPPATQQQPQTSARMWAEIRRHPQGVVHGMREQGWSDKEIRAALDDMTNDAIAPGTVRGQVAVDDQAAALKREAERVNRLEQHIVSREREAFVAQERRDFTTIATAKEGDEHLYPLSAALSDDKRYALAEWLASRKQAGTFTLESLALDLEEELQSLVPTLTAKPPDPPPPPAAKTTRTRAALPPDLAGESGIKPTRPLSLEQRSAAIRRNAAKMFREPAR